MLAEKTAETPRMTEASHKLNFFRQSGWMMIATVAGGFFMWVVQCIVSKVLPTSEYSAVGTLFQLLNWMTIPALGLQMVFAQQTSAAITETQRRQLVSTVKAVMRWTFCIWVLMAVTAFVGQKIFVAELKLSNPAALWLTVLVSLTMLWLPIFQGLLQGRQNFLWLGWVAIFNGVGRVFIVGLIVILLHGWTAGVMTGVLIGLLTALGFAAWQNRDLWSESGAPFDSRGWLWRVVPLALGFGAGQFIFSADAIVVQNYLGGEGAAAPYMFGGTLARAIVLFTGPLAAVMFPKLVHSAARAEKNELN
ncbi:MAG TPA: hypothetical protein VH598_14595, partial [Verrucomicrobiae bacterium]|nr:hypothetical protein [Verrucomicrobiae bacterium]